MKREHLTTLGWLAVGALVWGGAVVVQRLRPTPERLEPWQAKTSSLTEPQQTFASQLLEALPEAERARAGGSWPQHLRGLTLQQQRLTVNYVGQAAGVWWLVLIVEPPSMEAQERVELDRTHHRLSTGLLIHVSLWTRDTQPEPGLVAFPAVEGWTERVP